MLQVTWHGEREAMEAGSGSAWLCQRFRGTTRRLVVGLVSEPGLVEAGWGVREVKGVLEMNQWVDTEE